MNIRMTYLYQDAGNYKHWYDIVFPNRSGKSAAKLTDEIRKHLISGQFFDRKFAPLQIESEAEYDKALDHSWLEFHDFLEVEESPQASQDISEFIANLGQ